MIALYNDIKINKLFSQKSNLTNFQLRNVIKFLFNIFNLFEKFCKKNLNFWTLKFKRAGQYTP